MVSLDVVANGTLLWPSYTGRFSFAHRIIYNWLIIRNDFANWIKKNEHWMHMLLIQSILSSSRLPFFSVAVPTRSIYLINSMYHMYKMSGVFIVIAIYAFCVMCVGGYIWMRALFSTHQSMFGATNLINDMWIICHIFTNHTLYLACNSDWCTFAHF